MSDSGKKDKYELMRQLVKEFGDSEDYFSITFVGVTDGKGQSRAVMTANNDGLTLYLLKFGGKVKAKNVIYSKCFPYNTITELKISKRINYSLKMRVDVIDTGWKKDGKVHNLKFKILVPNGLYNAIKLRKHKEDVQKLIEFLKNLKQERSI